MIRNESKWTISTSGGFGLLQVVSEPVTGRCASKDTVKDSRNQLLFRNHLVTITS